MDRRLDESKQELEQDVIDYSSEDHEDKTRFPSILTNSFLILFVGALATLALFVFIWVRPGS